MFDTYMSAFSFDIFCIDKNVWLCYVVTAGVQESVDLPVLVGSGVTVENINEYLPANGKYQLQFYHGTIASHIVYNTWADGMISLTGL